MAKLPEEVIKEIYEKGYANGKADAYREASKFIKFVSRLICNALNDEAENLNAENNAEQS